MLNFVVESILSKGPDGQLSARVLGQEFGHAEASTHIHPTVTFLLCLAIFPKCTDNSIWSICASRRARFWAWASAEAVSPQLIEKNQKKCVRRSQLLHGQLPELFLALPHIEGLHCSTTSEGCIVSNSAMDLSTTSGWWIMSNSVVASFPAKVNMANSPPGCRDKKFETL